MEHGDDPTRANDPAAAAGVVPGPLEAPDHDVRAVLAIPTFRRLWLALTFSSFGDWLGLMATMSMASVLAGDNTALAGAAVSATLIMRLLPSLVLGPFAGALADRFDRRWTMVAGDVVRFLLFCSIPLVGSLTWLFVATLLIECAALVWGPAKEATVPNLVPRRRLEAANQISLAATYGTAPVAALVYSALSLLTGILDNYLDFLAGGPVDLALYVNGVSFLVSAITISRLNIPRGPVSRTERPEPLLRSMIEGWRFVGGTPVVRGLVLGMLGAFAAAGLVIGPAQQFVRALGAGDPGYGLLFGAVFVGLAAGMWLGPRFLPDLSRRRLFGLSLACAGALLTALALIPNIVIATLLTAGLGAFGGLAWVTGYTLLGLVVDDDVRGRTFGFLQSAARLVLVLVLAAAPPLAGLIGDHTFRFTPMVALTYSGAAVVYLVAGLVALALGVAAFRQMDDRRGVALRHDLVAAWQARTSPRPAAAALPVVGARGLFIAFEGGDGAGKSTQARLLGEWLETDGDHDVLLTREPGGSDVGAQLRSLLLERTDLDPRAEALIFAADRAQHVATVVRPALEAGTIVVTDRYVDSSVAYQGAGQALDPGEVERLSGWATQHLLPDLTVVLDLPPVRARERRDADPGRSGEDRIEAGGLEFHARVREHFLALARRAPHRYLVVDASLSPEEIHALVRERLAPVLPVSARRRRQLLDRVAAGRSVAGRHGEPTPGRPWALAAPSTPPTGEPATPGSPSLAPPAISGGDVPPEHGPDPAPVLDAVPALDAVPDLDEHRLTGTGPLRQDELLTMALPLAEPDMARPFVPRDAGAAPAFLPHGDDRGDHDLGHREPRVQVQDQDGDQVRDHVADDRRPGPRRLLREQEQRARASTQGPEGSLHDDLGPVGAAAALAAQLTEVLPLADLTEVYRSPGLPDRALPVAVEPAPVPSGESLTEVVPLTAEVEDPLVLGHAGMIDLRELRDVEATEVFPAADVVAAAVAAPPPPEGGDVVAGEANPDTAYPDTAYPDAAYPVDAHVDPDGRPQRDATAAEGDLGEELFGRFGA